MEKQGKGKFSAVAFDLDGTLYPNYRFNILAFPSVLKNLKLLLAFNKVRKLLHQEPGADADSSNRAGSGSNFSAGRRAEVSIRRLNSW